jgi:hypothetical protein
MEHYRTSKLQAIDVIREWDLDFALGNVVKYVARAGKKKSASREDDLLKALWYLVYELTDDTDYADDCTETVKSDIE